MENGSQVSIVMVGETYRGRAMCPEDTMLLLGIALLVSIPVTMPFIFLSFVKTLRACLATLWAMLLVLKIIVVDSLQALLLEQIHDSSTIRRIQKYNLLEKLGYSVFVNGLDVDNLVNNLTCRMPHYCQLIKILIEVKEQKQRQSDNYYLK